MVSEFTGDVEEERYFFCRIKNEAMSGDSSAVRKRVVGASGYWKLTGTEKQIITLPLNAIKSRFLFCEGGGGEDQGEEEEDEGGGGSTDAAQAQPKWIMHEFRPQYQVHVLDIMAFGSSQRISRKESNRAGQAHHGRSFRESSREPRT